MKWYGVHDFDNIMVMLWWWLMTDSTTVLNLIMSMCVAWLKCCGTVDSKWACKGVVIMGLLKGQESLFGLKISWV